MIAAGLRFRGAWRLWAPVIGLVVGSAIGGFAFGIYDTASVGEAAWVGLPPVVHVGFDLGFGPAFWALLPAFVFVTLVGAMDTLGDTIAVQRVSWRRPRAIDFRSVQGAGLEDEFQQSKNLVVIHAGRATVRETTRTGTPTPRRAP